MHRGMLNTVVSAAVTALICAAASAQMWEAPLTITATDVVSGKSVALATNQTATAQGAGLSLDIRQIAQDPATPNAARGPQVPVRIVEVDVRDATGQDRAVDLGVALDTALAGWSWHNNIHDAVQMSPASELTERQYPLVVVTPEDGGAGFAFAIEPSQPLIYQLRGTAEGISLQGRLGLTAAGAGDLKSQAHVRVYLFPVDGRWGFRDALATYYRLFPTAFERRAMNEGQWLFAFQNSDLPNPAHYAYHEGGPTGWEYDEEHGIGTYPYTEVSSRTLHMHRLPKDRQDAFAAYEEYKQDREFALADWSIRGGIVDATVARTGDRSLRCTKDDPAAWMGASQDLMVDQDEPGPITVGGWLKAEAVTGDNPRDLSLYADVQLQSGEWQFGEIASFEDGTHDWQQATHTIDLAEPVRMVRLHCLFRHGYTGTVWFDDISVAEGADGPNLAENPSFEEIGINQGIAAVDAYHVEAADGGPVLSIRTDLSSDVKPETPLKLLRFTLNPNPYLPQAEGAELAPGPKSIANYVNMMQNIPALDGAYIDSVSAWATGVMDFRREHFGSVRHNFSYDPESKRVVAPGKYYTYDFLDELGEALRPLDGHVFTNIHNTMDTFLLYAVSDVPGIESSITDHQRFSYIRSASYQKPAVLLNFLNLLNFDERAKHDHHWRMAVLYGLYPSFGRRCDEAYELYGDLYRRFMPSLKRISAAGWEPVTRAWAEPAGPRLERFGSSPDEGLFLTTYNEQAGEYDGELVLDAGAFGISDGMVIRDTTSGMIARLEIVGGVARSGMPIRSGEVAVWQIGSPEMIAQTAREELEQITVDLRRAEREMPDAIATRVRDLRGEIIGRSGIEPAGLTHETLDRLVSLYNDATVETTTWTGETPGQALLRAALLHEHARSADGLPVAMSTSGEAVGGEETRVNLYAGGETVTDVAFLLLTADGLRMVDTVFNWPEQGYGTDLIDLIGIGVDGGRGAVWQTYELLPALALSLETLDPGAPSPERILTARCHNNSSSLRQMRLRIEAPDDRWALTPAQWRELDVPAGETVETQFRLAPPAGTIRMQEMRLVAEAGAEELAATATALCGGPAPIEVNAARADDVEVSVDSSYSGYSSDTLNDGLLWPKDVHWTQHAWASTETAQDHWIRFDWSEPRDIQRVIVYWNVENERVYTSQAVVVEVEKDGVWMPLAEAEPLPGDAATTILLSPTRTSGIRVMQPEGMGSIHRPDLMWVTEVQVGR